MNMREYLKSRLRKGTSTDVIDQMSDWQVELNYYGALTRNLNVAITYLNVVDGYHDLFEILHSLQNKLMLDRINQKNLEIVEAVSTLKNLLSPCSEKIDDMSNSSLLGTYYK